MIHVPHRGSIQSSEKRMLGTRTMAEACAAVVYHRSSTHNKTDDSNMSTRSSKAPHSLMTRPRVASVAPQSAVIGSSNWPTRSHPTWCVQGSVGAESNEPTAVGQTLMERVAYIGRDSNDEEPTTSNAHTSISLDRRCWAHGTEH